MEMGVKEQDIVDSALQGSRRDLSRLLTLIESGFTIERLYEPALSERHFEGGIESTGTRSIPRILIIVCSI